MRWSSSAEAGGCAAGACGGLTFSHSCEVLFDGVFSSLGAGLPAAPGASSSTSSRLDAPAAALAALAAPAASPLPFTAASRAMSFMIRSNTSFGTAFW